MRTCQFQLCDELMRDRLWRTLASSSGPSGTCHLSSDVVRDDGSGKPKYETKRESSFKTNVPGLAERLAEEGKAPEEMLAVPLFPF